MAEDMEPKHRLDPEPRLCDNNQKAASLGQSFLSGAFEATQCTFYSSDSSAWPKSVLFRAKYCAKLPLLTLAKLADCKKEVRSRWKSQTKLRRTRVELGERRRSGALLFLSKLSPLLHSKRRNCSSKSRFIEHNKEARTLRHPQMVAAAISSLSGQVLASQASV